METQYLVDLSHWDGEVNFAQLKSDGIVGVIAKATEGLNTIDDQFSRNRQQAKKYGMVFGMYHFFHPSEDASGQVAHFQKVIDEIAPNEMGPILDFEVNDGLADSGIAAPALKWLEMAQSALGKKAMVYIDPDMLERMGHPLAFANYALWLAEYNSVQTVPAPFKSAAIWQFTDTEKLLGMSGNFDVNKFNGTLAQLQSFAATGTV